MLIFTYKNRWENSARTVYSDDSLAQLFLMIKGGQKSVRFVLIYIRNCAQVWNAVPNFFQKCAPPTVVYSLKVNQIPYVEQEMEGHELK